MKNIHVLPTGETIAGIKTKNIYITSDEEIKEGDWVYNIVSKTKFKATKELIDLINDPNVTLTTNKKIILTTEQDLIKDGVQAIDDEFLEWFVKNPSCEEVEVIYIDCENCIKLQGQESSPDCCHNYQYKIIIPKEETKCYCGHTTYCDCGPEETQTDNSHPTSQFEQEDKCPSCGSPCNIYTDLDDNDECNDCRNQIDGLMMGQIIPKEEPFKHEMRVLSKEEVLANRSSAYEFIDFDKQETLEELAIQKRNELGLKGTIDGFIAGFEIAKERMYSEEEVVKILLARNADLGIIGKTSAVIEFIKQFKKK